MPLTAQQLAQFDEEGYLFLPGCFMEEEVAMLCDEAERFMPPTAARSGARRPGRRAPPSPPTPITTPSAY